MLKKLLLALLVIIVCKAIASIPALKPVVILAVCAAALFMSLYLPDTDLLLQGIPYVRGFVSQLLGLAHRSWVTHSCIWVLVMMLIARLLFDNDVAIAAGFATAAGLAWHLGCDMFPKAWAGSAYITFPFWLGKIPFIGAILSWIWLGANILGGFAIPASAIKDRG